ncbi:MAG: U32 family peptidase [Bacteriovoracaceae bacterium]|nr:U32 family peptidase [Bacteriovoracaceae bacterium]
MMQINTYVRNHKEIELCRENRVMEVILAHKDFSRTGDLSDISELAQICQQFGIRTVFEWDIIMTENDFQKCAEKFKTFDLKNISAIRVQDPGALEYCLNHTELPIQLVLENGNHNLVGLKKWRGYVGERLERMVLSIELPEATLKEYIEALDVPVEILVLGPILLFYSPRKLLSVLGSDKEEIIASGSSEESPHKGFPLIENRHGTFMFHIKDQSLMEYLEDLSQINLAYGRVDLRQRNFRLLENVARLNAGDKNEITTIKNEYGTELTKGYFHVNKTDVLFPKLKNQRLLPRDDSFLGEVLDVSNKNYFAILMKKNAALTVGQKIKILSPQGKEIFLTVERVRNSLFEVQQSIESGYLALLDFHSGVLPKSLVFKAE